VRKVGLVAERSGLGVSVNRLTIARTLTAPTIDVQSSEREASGTSRPCIGAVVVDLSEAELDRSTASWQVP
jgi:hypothetical protein